MGDKGEDAEGFERTEEKRELIDLSCGLKLEATGQSRRPTLLRRNGKGVARQLLGGNCGLLGDSCGRSELPRRDADEALEVPG